MVKVEKRKKKEKVKNKTTVLKGYGGKLSSVSVHNLMVQYHNPNEIGPGFFMTLEPVTFAVTN